MVLTPVVFWLAARFDLTTPFRRLPHLLLHAGASFGLTLLQRALSRTGLALLAVPGIQLSWSALLATVNVWVPLYWMLLFVAYALELYDKFRQRTRDAARLEIQLVQAQLQALKMQLNPHFLFNTLNAVTALIGDDPEAAQRMTAKLGAFLRTVLDNTDEQQVPLAQELRLTELYLEMEQIRFADRLTVTYQLDTLALPALVPNLLLQPLVENAVKHGLATTTASACIHIEAQREGQQLVLQVHDNGRGASSGEARGVGLRNSEERLRTLYGTHYALAIRTAPEEGFTVRIELPLAFPPAT
ncbi:MAG: histidine kinase [Deltaproteobacteria bacterium]|nr:MAG: histidine kinase [Deltaproteobacteria bacterium]